MTKHLAFGILLALVNCGWSGGLRDQLRRSDYHLSLADRLRLEASAPLIVLGRVLDVIEMGNPAPSRGDPRIKTQLDRIRIEVEEVVKGRWSQNTLEFYYFVYSAAASGIDLGEPRYLPQLGQRRLYFLKPTKNSFRSVGDITDYTLRVSTGRHPRGFCSGKSPGCCIAAILLAPQPGLDVSWFVPDLARSAYAAEVLYSRTAAQEFLKYLAQDSDKSIAERAREIIAAGQPLQ